MEMQNLPGGIQFYSFRDTRFKQGALSIQFIRPMKKEEAAANALLPAVLLRGTVDCPDLRSITLKLDDLYGASVSTLVRRVGDYQTTGLYCNFMEDRFALDGDEILSPMVEFLGSLLMNPLLENGCFSTDFVESEKKNLIATIESEINDKRTYATAQLMKLLCREDSFGLPRLGEKADVEAITPAGLFAHYQKILKESPVQVFYVGSAEPAQVAKLLADQFAKITRKIVPLAPQTALAVTQSQHVTEQKAVAQANLCMGFVTPIVNSSKDYGAIRVMNVLFGAGMTSKLFMNVREKLSLCYSIGSNYHGTKGIVTVYAGIDDEKEEITRQEILRQLEACQKGEITPQELAAAKEALLAALQTVHDSPGSIENYYSTAVLSQTPVDHGEYIRCIEAVTAEDVTRVANTLQYHSSYILKKNESHPNGKE